MPGRLLECLIRLILANITGDDRHTGGSRPRARGAFITHQGDGFGHGANRNEPGRLAGASKISVFGQKANPRMNRLHPRPSRSLKDGVYTEIRLNRWGRPNVNGRIRLRYVQRIGISIGVNRHCPNPQPSATPNNPAGNLAAIGN
jgi:hypothetical protein